MGSSIPEPDSIALLAAGAACPRASAWRRSQYVRLGRFSNDADCSGHAMLVILEEKRDAARFARPVPQAAITSCVPVSTVQIVPVPFGSVLRLAGLPDDDGYSGLRARQERLPVSRLRLRFKALIACGRFCGRVAVSVTKSPWVAPAGTPLLVSGIREQTAGFPVATAGVPLARPVLRWRLLCGDMRF